MYKNSFFSAIIAQFVGIGIGIRIACGMLTASIRSGYAFCGLLCLIAISLLHYFDVIIRAMFSGGSFMAWAIINIFKKRGIAINVDFFGVKWLLHLPEYLLIFMLFALISLIMVHIVNNSLDGKQCGIGRSFFRALRSWRFIITYAFFMSGMVWLVGDVYLNGIRFLLKKVYELPLLMEIMYEPLYGKKVLSFLLTESRYWFLDVTRFTIAAVWYVGTFLLFQIVAAEQCSFFKGVYRSFKIALFNIGIVWSAAFFYLFMYIGVIAATLYSQVATFTSLEGLSTRSNVQVIALFAFMALILFTVHSAVVLSGSLIAGSFIYRIVQKQKIRAKNAFMIDRPYLSSFLYILFYIFYWIIIRCGIHVQMPNI
jgi:hypothetical protein